MRHGEVGRAANMSGRDQVEDVTEGTGPEKTGVGWDAGGAGQLRCGVARSGR
jgi:hypothetical protein